MDLSHLPGLFLLIFGFGFVIFWHELGHFLAAKWAGVRVEQFAVGFGQPLMAWRKGNRFSTGRHAKGNAPPGGSVHRHKNARPG